jgi:hypothetical protein
MFWQIVEKIKTTESLDTVDKFFSSMSNADLKDAFNEYKSAHMQANRQEILNLCYFGINIINGNPLVKEFFINSLISLGEKDFDSLILSPDNFFNYYNPTLVIHNFKDIFLKEFERRGLDANLKSFEIKSFHRETLEELQNNYPQTYKEYEIRKNNGLILSGTFRSIPNPSRPPKKL